jgi:hypothetical protein
MGAIRRDTVSTRVLFAQSFYPNRPRSIPNPEGIVKPFRSFPIRASLFAYLALFSLSILGLSCSSNGLQAVSGKVNYKGQPIQGALVTLHPKASMEDIKVHRPSGITDEQGNFTLTTGKDTGAAPGEYIVTVVWMKQPEGAPTKPKGFDMGLPEPVDQLQGRYANMKNSKITVTVKSGTNQLEPINLD